MVDGVERAEAKSRRSIWLLTFADVTALLLAFFVMLFSMSTLQSERWQDIISRISVTDKPTEKAVRIPQAPKNVATVSSEEALPLNYLARVLEATLAEDEVLSGAIVHRLDQLVVVSLPSDAMFRQGEASLTDRAREALFRMGGVVASISNRIDVRGHTDPAPGTTGAFTSKWAVSLARAAAVANELRSTGYRRQIPIYGLADTRYSHLDKQIPEQMRYRLARRVDVVIHPHSGEI